MLRGIKTNTMLRRAEPAVQDCPLAVSAPKGILIFDHFSLGPPTGGYREKRHSDVRGCAYDELTKHVSIRFS